MRTPTLLPLPLALTLLAACTPPTTKVTPDPNDTTTDTATQTGTDSATDTATQTDTGTDTSSNNPPTDPHVWLSPAVPHTGDEIWAAAVATDPDGDVLSYRFVWSIDGVEQPDLTGSFVPGERVARGDAWSVSVVATDGEDTSGAGTAQVTVANSAPSITSVTLTPAAVYTNTVLTANVTGADRDLVVGDSIAYTYVWLVDGAPIDAGGPTLDGATAFDKGDTVSVRVIPRDDADAEGAAVTSAGVVVLDSPPTAPVVEITPADPVAGDDITCNIVAPSTDADGDSPITYSFMWEVGGEAYVDAATSATNSVVAGVDVGSGQTWTCEVTAEDQIGAARASSIVEVTTATDCWSLRLNGASDFLETYDTSESRASTFALWVKPTSTTDHDMGLVMNDGIASHTVSMDILSGGYPLWAVTDGNYSAATNDTWSWVLGTAPVPSGAWTHIAGTWSGTTITLYVNGDAIGSSAEGYPMNRGYTTRFGMSVRGGYETHFDGHIADIQVYPTALSAADIATIAAHPFSSVAGVEAQFLDGTASLRDAMTGNLVAVAHGTSWVADCP